MVTWWLLKAANGVGGGSSQLYRVTNLWVYLLTYLLTHSMVQSPS